MTEPKKQTDHSHAVRSFRRQIWIARIAGWPMLLAAIALLVFILSRFGQVEQGMRHGGLYLGTLALALAWFYLVPLVLSHWLANTKARVSSSGSRWTIGKYSELDVREIQQRAAVGLSPFVQRIQVTIDDQRYISAWTQTALLGFAWPHRLAIRLSSGMLHYLDADELQAVILHEMAHHLPENRTSFPFLFVLNDVVLHGIAFAVYLFVVPSATVLVGYLMGHAAWASLHAIVQLPAERNVEHFCDLFGARHSSCNAMINALLKLGEEEELTEAVLVWAARELLYEQTLCMDDLQIAFWEARPYGRVFHENIFRHAAEIVKKLDPHLPEPEIQKTKSRRWWKRKVRKKKANLELELFIKERRERKKPRIRWRRFDQKNRGRLADQEIEQLCLALRTRLDHVLVRSDNEQNPITHPPIRERILFVELGCREE